jgi:hypothetical protein
MTDLTSASSAPTSSPIADAEPPIWSRETAAAAGAMALLVVVADVLFCWHEPGINFALYGFVLIAGVIVLHRRRTWRLRSMGLLAVALAAQMPMIESENFLWWPASMLVVSLFAVDVAGQLPSFESWFGAMTRFVVLGPARLIVDGLRLLGAAGEQQLGGKVWRLVLVWLVPVVCAAIFAMLFVAANPVLELGLQSLQLRELLKYLDPGRLVLWGFFAFVSWPILVPRLLHWTPLPEMQGPMLPKAESLVFGAAAIRNSLIVFNALFAVQTAMDLLYLWGGIRLPDGVTYADYAHHAAYPLIVTAVLAGAFVLAAMHKDGPGRSSPLIANLVYLWIAQNVWLVISAILRLKLYVEAYALSEMRILAGIWMLLVAVGLILVLAKIILDKSNGWLVMANCASLAVALYGVAWIDFPAVISQYNVEHSHEMTGQGFPLDIGYFEELGPGTIPAIDQLLEQALFAEPNELDRFATGRDYLALSSFADQQTRLQLAPVDWQSWTWRQERLRQYLVTHPFAPDAAARHN